MIYVSVPSFLKDFPAATDALRPSSSSWDSVWDVFFLVAYESGSNLETLAINCFPSISGITFMLINARVALGWAYQVNSTSTGPNRGVSTLVFGPRDQVAHAQSGTGTASAVDGSEMSSFVVHPVNLAQATDKNGALHEQDEYVKQVPQSV